LVCTGFTSDMDILSEHRLMLIADYNEKMEPKKLTIRELDVKIHEIRTGTAKSDAGNDKEPAKAESLELQTVDIETEGKQKLAGIEKEGAAELAKTYAGTWCLSRLQTKVYVETMYRFL
jgi:hypothetical protein